MASSKVPGRRRSTSPARRPFTPVCAAAGCTRTTAGARTLFYDDFVIYSPDVPVFRDDDGHLLDEPWRCTILTSPAVHAHGVRRQRPVAGRGDRTRDAAADRPGTCRRGRASKTRPRPRG